MAINILQELNLGAAKASFSRDEVETLADIKKLNIAQKYPNNYDIFCKEDGCKYRLNKTSHSTMQDNLPHPTGKWRRVDSVISSSMPAPITVGDVILYLGPTVVDRTDPLNPVVKYQTGKYYRTEYTEVTKQMYAFVQNTAPDVPDTSPTPAVIWFSETSTLSEGSVLFTPVDSSIFNNKEHGIIMTSDWDGESAISGSSYEYLDNSNSAKLGIVRNSNFDTTFDSYPELTWNLFDTEAELENIKQNVIPEAISSTVDANLGQAKKLNDILTDGDIKLLKQGGIEKLVSSKPDATVSDSTIGFVQCDCNRNEETGEVTLNITNVKYGPFTSEEIAENAFVDENEIIVPSGGQFTVYAITCSVTNRVKDAIFYTLKDSNLYQGTINFDVMNFISRLQEGLPLVVGFAAAAPYKDEEHSGSVNSNTYVSIYNLLDYIDGYEIPPFTPIPVSEIPDIKNRAVELLENETALDLILFVMGGGDADAQLATSNILELLNEQFIIGTEASGILNEFPTMKNEIEDSITEEFSNVKKLNDSLNEEDVDAIVSRPRESIFDVKSPYITYGNKLLTECTFVKLEFDNGKATITDSATVSDVMADLPGGIQEWLHDGCPAVLFGIKQNNNYIGSRYGDTYTVSHCSFKVDSDPLIDVDRKPENMFGISEVYFAIGNNENERQNIIADFTTCKFTNISIYAPETEDDDGRHLFGDLIGGYEEDGDPITLKYYNKSDYTVLYGIALLTASPNIVSVTDFTVKNVIASINKRVIPMYQESGILVDFPKMKEQITSVKEMADEFGTVKQNANKAVELALPKKTGDFIKDNIVNFKEITPLSIPGSSSYSQDKVKFDGFVSLGVSTYDPTDTNRTIAPVFKNYFDDTQSDYVTSDNLMTDVPTKGWGRYVGIMGSIFSTTYNNQGKSAFENALHSTYCEYNRSKSIDMLFNRISTHFNIVDVYVRYYGNNDIDGNLTTGWIRVEPGTNIWNLISGSSFYTGFVQVCVIVKGWYGDWYFENADPFTANTNTILDLVSFTDKKLDLNKIEDVLSINGLDSAVDATKSIIQKYPIKLAYSFADDTKFNGALKINADTYDPETTTSVSLSFYNYYDSSKDDYRNPANPATPMLVEDKFVAVAAYIDIPEVLGIPPYSSAAQLKEHCKNISVRFDRTKSIKVDLQNNNNTSIYSGANVFIRDIYFKANSITQAPALANYTYSTKITNSNPMDELVDASDSTQFIPIFVFILEVIPDTNYSVPLKNYLAQQNFAKFINSLCEISFNKVRDVEDAAQEAIENMSSVTGDISALEERTSAIETKLDPLTDEMISEIAGAEEEVKEFIYGGNADGFVEVYNREAQYMYEMDLEKQKSSTDIASYFYNSDDFTSIEYTTDAGSTYTLYGFSGPSYYFVPFPTDAIDLYLASAAEENKISYENKIADASQSEEALEVLNNSFVTSAVNDNKCLLVSNTILLNKENEEESRTVSAEELDSVLANDVEVTLGTYDCDTFTYDIDEAYVGIAIYTDALKMIHDFKPELEQDPEFETGSGMYKLMYDLNDGSMTYLRIGVRNVENLDANHIRFTLGDEEYFGGLKDYILSRALEEIQNMFTSIGITYTEEAALEYVGVRLSVLTYIHIHRDNEAILDVNSLYDSNLSNSLAEHIRVLSDGKNFIDSTNESFQSLKNHIKSSKLAIDKSISGIKSDMSDMDTKIDGVIETIEEVNETLSPDIMAILNKTSDSFSEIDFDTNSKLKNLANINNKLDLSVIAPNWYEAGYNAFVNLGEGYVLGRSRIYPEYINYFTDDSDYGEKDDISNVFIDAVDYSMAHSYIQKYIGLCLYSDFINNDYVNTITENGETPSRYDFIRSLIMNKPHIDFTKFTDNYRKQMIRSDNGDALATVNSVVDVYVAAIAGEPEDINSYVWKKYTSADTIIEVFTSALDTMNTSVLSKMNQIKLGIILVIDCTLKSNDYSVFANYDKVDTKEFFAKNISISDNRINKAIESYNRSESIKDTPEVMYLPSTISCMVSATNTEQGKTFDFAAIIQPNISAPMEDNGDGTYTLPQVSDTYNTYGYTKINDVITSGTMWYTAGFFGEELSPGLSARSFSSDLIGTTPILSHRTKLAWYDAEYMKGINTSLKSKYPTKEHDPRVYNENLNEKTNVDVSELFLNIDTRIVKEIYIRVISEGNNMGYPNLASYINTYSNSIVNGVPYVSIYVQDIPGFKKIPINTKNDIYTISMQRVIDICGRPLFANNISEINKGAYILFCIKIDTTQIPTLYALGEAEAFDWYRVGTLYNYNSLTEADGDSYYNKRMVLYNSLFNDIEHSPKYCSGLWHAVYISGSVDQSLRETKNIVYDEVNSKTSKIAKYCSSDNDLNYLETGGIGYRARKDTEDNSKYLADVYMKTEDGSVIKIAEGRQITTPSPELIRILSDT